MAKPPPPPPPPPSRPPPSQKPPPPPPLSKPIHKSTQNIVTAPKKREFSETTSKTPNHNAAKRPKLLLSKFEVRKAARLRDVEAAYTKIQQVGQGTYGSVFMGKDKVTHEVVALKRINTKQEENGFPITALREVKILKALDSDHIVKLKEIVTSKGNIQVLLISVDFLQYSLILCTYYHKSVICAFCFVMIFRLHFSKKNHRLQQELTMKME